MPTTMPTIAPPMASPLVPLMVVKRKARPPTHSRKSAATVMVRPWLLCMMALPPANPVTKQLPREHPSKIMRPPSRRLTQPKKQNKPVRAVLLTQRVRRFFALAFRQSSASSSLRILPYRQLRRRACHLFRCVRSFLVDTWCLAGEPRSVRPSLVVRRTS